MSDAPVLLGPLDFCSTEELLAEVTRRCHAGVLSLVLKTPIVPSENTVMRVWGPSAMVGTVIGKLVETSVSQALVPLDELRRARTTQPPGSSA